MVLKYSNAPLIGTPLLTNNSVIIEVTMVRRSITFSHDLSCKESVSCLEGCPL